MIPMLFLYAIPAAFLFLWSLSVLIPFAIRHRNRPYSEDFPIVAVLAAALFWVPALNLLASIWLSIYCCTNYAYDYKNKRR